MIISMTGKGACLAAAVDALRVGEHELQLLGKLRQAAGGVARGGDEHPGVALPRMRVPGTKPLKSLMPLQLTTTPVVPAQGRES